MGVPLEPCLINWSNFSLNVPEHFSETCYIYVDKYKVDLDKDIEKIYQILKIENLKEIVLSADDFRVAEYFDTLLKDFKGKKLFDLLNDFEIKDRGYLDFTKLNYRIVGIPFDYIMYGIKEEGVSRYNVENIRVENIIRANFNIQNKYKDTIEKINGIIDEIFGDLPLEELDDIDKSVLVSNWIQKHIQFTQGKETSVGNRKLLCDEYEGYEKMEDIKVVIDKHYGVCNAIAKLTMALLSNPRIKCKCNMAHSPLHSYVTQNIDGQLYITDNTWCITRNPHKVGDCLKATEFYDGYLLIGNDKINEDEATLKYHTRDGIFKGVIADKSIPRERIKQSIDKLKTLGVDFEYGNDVIFRQYFVDKEKEYVKK